MKVRNVERKRLVVRRGGREQWRRDGSRRERWDSKDVVSIGCVGDGSGGDSSPRCMWSRGRPVASGHGREVGRAMR